MLDPIFLGMAEMIELHQIAIQREGGSDGIRDVGTLESAVNMPAQMFRGEYLHPDVPAMGAAYLFHICQAHAFVDGNKRVAVLAFHVFMTANGYVVTADEETHLATMLRLASGKITKDELTDWVREHSAPNER